MTEHSCGGVIFLLLTTLPAYVLIIRGVASFAQRVSVARDPLKKHLTRGAHLMTSRIRLISTAMLTVILLQPGDAALSKSKEDALDLSRAAASQATCQEASRPALPAKLGRTMLTNPVSKSEDRTTFHVSPDGDDTWSGRLSVPNAQRDDGPFARIEFARDAARMTSGPSTIAIAGGDYYLSQPVVFDARDAGLIVTAKCNEKPVLHGGLRITDWTMLADGRWIAPLKLPSDVRLGNLIVNDKVQPQARFPNAPVDDDKRKGWLFAARCQPPIDIWEGNTRFCYHPGDLPPLGDVTGLVAHIVGASLPGAQWGSDTLPVDLVEATAHTVRTGGTGYFFTSEGSRYFLAGTRAFLDAPGEWWHDQKDGLLTYISADRKPPGPDVVAGILPTIFKLEDADGMVVSGLSLRDGAPDGSGKFYTETRGYGAIRLEHSDNVKLLGNVVQNIGVGIHVSESNNVLIAGNAINATAGNGIYIGTAWGSFGKSNDAKILSNRISNIGEVYFETAGIWFQAGSGIRIADNVIENTAQFGIAGGSIWGLEDAVYDAVIERNVIRNANQQTADGAAIKMMGAQGDALNSIIRNNLVTGTGHLMNRADGTFWPVGYEDIAEWPSPISWAIYTDGRASGVRIENNTLSGNVAAIGINGGWSNLVTGNQIKNGSGAAFRIDDATGRGWRPAWASANRIEDNTVRIDKHDGVAAFVYAPSHQSGYVRFSRNRYIGNLNDRSFRVSPGAMPSGEYGSLHDLEKAGMDAGSTEERLD